MANPYTTTDDLKAAALWQAGEPTDGSSSFDTQVMVYMQQVYDTLVNGGSIGTRDIATSAGLYERLVTIPTTDWMWLRKYPPFAFNTTPAIIGSAASVAMTTPTPEQIGTVTLTFNSTAVVFSIAPSVSVAKWRLKLQSQAQGIINPPFTVPRIVTHVANNVNAVLDAPWPQETQTASNFVLFQYEYPLPADFVRFCEAPTVQGGFQGTMPPRLNIGNNEQVGDQFPLTELSQGAPTEAARISTGFIQMNRWDTQAYRIEFPYIFTPDALEVGAMVPQEPLVPLRFRHLLATGAAMLVAQDKSDVRDVKLASQCREFIAHMGAELRHEYGVGSELAGRHLFRRGQNGRRGLRTASGLPLFTALAALLLR